MPGAATSTSARDGEAAWIRGDLDDVCRRVDAV
jgi:hypothetical protein